MSNQIEEACRRYVAGVARRDSLDRDGFVNSARNHPEETWAVLSRQFDGEVSDDVLRYAAVEILDAVRVYGGEDLWATIRESASSSNLRRLVHSLERYHDKYRLLFDLLDGVSVSERGWEEVDLSLPNPYDEDPRHDHDHGKDASSLSTQQKNGFVRKDQESWEAVQDLTESSPSAAWAVAMELVRDVPDSSLSWVGIGLIESLITNDERELASAVVEQVRTNARFRVALSSCYLNPSEAFLDSLIEAASRVV